MVISDDRISRPFDIKKLAIVERKRRGKEKGERKKTKEEKNETERTKERAARWLKGKIKQKERKIKKNTTKR